MLSSKCPTPSRRKLILGLISAGPLSWRLLPSLARADDAVSSGDTFRPAKVLNALEDRATAAGIAINGVGERGAKKVSDDYGVLLPRVLDLIDSAAAAGPAGQEIVDKASELLSEINLRERSFANAEERATAPAFEKLKPEYRKLFDSCEVRPERQSFVAQQVAFLLRHQTRYEVVGKRLSIPWYFVGIIHGLEASYNFNGHLHNGDFPLSKRTVHVPKNRPLVWSPPSDWESSAVDALSFEGFKGQLDWSLEHMLFRWETYNGFGSRGYGIKTPYLWSYSKHYTKGKYVQDGQWNASAVSQQCGAAVLLKSLVEEHQIVLPS